MDKQGDNLHQTIYWRCFLGIIFVLNIIAFYAIAVRLNQYGVTPERYFVFMGCVALAGMVIFNLFFKNPPLKTAILLICIFAFSAFGARFNAINLSLDSQKRQFELEFFRSGAGEIRYKENHSNILHLKATGKAK